MILNITDSAVKKVKSYTNDPEFENENIIGMRISIYGGGCSGFNYSFELISETNEDDLLFEKDGVVFAVDPLSMMYLDNATLDYIIEDFSERFVVNNPNAQTTCGCGSSFSI